MIIQRKDESETRPEGNVVHVLGSMHYEGGGGGSWSIVDRLDFFTIAPLRCVRGYVGFFSFYLSVNWLDWRKRTDASISLTHATVALSWFTTGREAPSPRTTYGIHRVYNVAGILGHVPLWTSLPRAIALAQQRYAFPDQIIPRPRMIGSHAMLRAHFRSGGSASWIELFLGSRFQRRWFRWRESRIILSKLRSAKKIEILQFDDSDKVRTATRRFGRLRTQKQLHSSIFHSPVYYKNRSPRERLLFVVITIYIKDNSKYNYSVTNKLSLNANKIYRCFLRELLCTE